jgi:cation diffusion facilitator family transporter
MISQEIKEMWNELKHVYLLNTTQIRIMFFVLLGGFLILLLKLWAYYITDSMALKSDALESLINILAGSFALFSLFFGNRPADKNHPYGHGKIEYFSAFFEGGLILLASILIVYEGFEKLYLGIHLKEITEGLFINFIAGSINGIMGYVLILKGKKYNSQALQADGHHLMTDFYTTISIFLGLLIVYFTDIVWLDPVIAILMGFYLMYTGITIMIKSTNSLLDTENYEIIHKIIDAINDIDEPTIITAHATRVMVSGNFCHIDIHFVVPEYLTIIEANTIIHDFEVKVLKKANLKGEFHTHADPCKQNYCRICRIRNCPIRVDEYQESQPLTYSQATSWPKEDKDRIIL